TIVLVFFFFFFFFLSFLLLANPRTLLLGAAAQFGIFATVLGALTLNYFGLISFTLPQAAAIGIIGGAD
ncbi:oxaloacetate decarboxylase subunit beta, partial [Salmonella enterica subsp. enterica serovar Newport str. SHSN005]|uniref:sodium ion-translocating decarboxylase subunit beta n=1 Tax=Salmonella enterica TaxID=28901 RepID=UPI000A183DDA